MSKKLPEGWKELSIDDVLKGKISGEWGKECEGKNEGVYVLRTTNFTNEGKLKLDEVVKRNIEENKVEKKMLQYGDIILEKSGGSENQPVGRVVYFDIQSNDIYLCNNFTQILRANPEVINSKYLLYVLFDIHRKGITEYFQNKTTGIRNLQTKSYLEQKIKVPPLEEQERIVSILERAESAKQKREESLKILDELVKSRFIEMFGDPYYNPNKWDIREFGEVFEISSSSRILKSEWKSEGIPFYRVRDMVKLSECGSVDNEYFVSEEFYSSLSSSKRTPQAGDIMVSATSTIGKCYVVKENEKFYYKDADVLRFRKKVELYPEYFIHFMKTQFAVNQIKSTFGITTVPHFTIVNSKKIKIPYPPIELQNEFADFVKQVDKLKFEMEDSLKELENNFNSLMQKAFKGELF